MFVNKHERFFLALTHHLFPMFLFILFLQKREREKTRREKEREGTSILITVHFNSFDTLCKGESIDEEEKVASKQTNRNARGSPTVINDHLVVILSPIKGVTSR